jgi:hypothetical protein
VSAHGSRKIMCTMKFESSCLTQSRRGGGVDGSAIAGLILEEKGPMCALVGNFRIADH